MECAYDTVVVDHADILFKPCVMYCWYSYGSRMVLRMRYLIGVGSHCIAITRNISSFSVRRLQLLTLLAKCSANTLKPRLGPLLAERNQ